MRPPSSSSAAAGPGLTRPPPGAQARTAAWTEFPDGRWVDWKAPPRELARLAAYQSVRPATEKGLAQRKALLAGGPLRDGGDVAAVFSAYYGRSAPGKAADAPAQLPWIEAAAPPAQMAELRPLARPLAAGRGWVAAPQPCRGIFDRICCRIPCQIRAFIARGLLVVSATPRVDGAPSASRPHGWGAPGGKVYQKASLGFFAPPEAAAKLEAALAPGGPLSGLTYLAADCQGKVR